MHYYIGVNLATCQVLALYCQKLKMVCQSVRAWQSGYFVHCASHQRFAESLDVNVEMDVDSDLEPSILETECQQECYLHEDALLYDEVRI